MDTAESQIRRDRFREELNTLLTRDNGLTVNEALAVLLTALMDIFHQTHGAD